jgi:general secretion pathway protein F
MQFSVRTLAPDMSIGSRIVDAFDEADARRQVETKGMFVSAIQPVRQTSVMRKHSGKLSPLLFSHELLALLAAGMGLVESLDALLEKESSVPSRTVLEGLLVGLREGKRFSTTLAAQPNLFPPLYVGIIRAAEGTGDLPRALARYIEYQQRIDLVRAKFVSASIYPLILLCVGGAVSTFLICYVVPRFSDVYQGAGRSLPWISRLMLDWGQFATHHAAGLASCSAVVVVAAALTLRRLLRRGGLAQLLGRVPTLGERARIIELSRLYLTLGMLANGGITIVAAIETVEPMLSPQVGTSLSAALAIIREGRPLSEAFEAKGLTTPISLRLLRVGERTGAIGPMLMQSASFYDGEISRWIDRFTRTFEPLLMAAIGLIVGAIVILLYMPIFDLAGDMP